MQNTKITSDEVKHIAKLAKLSLSDELIQKFSDQLTKVLDFMSSISQLDTKELNETYQVTGLENVFREDIIDESRVLSQKEALSNAKKTHNGYFVVESVFK